MNWRTPISVHEKGEVGRVYYVNTMIIMKDGEEWTQHTPITLNPDQGSTIEGMLKRSKEIPKKMKDALLRHRVSEEYLTSGIVVRIWICDYPAPEYWNPTDIQRREKARAENKAILYDHKGQII
jgi:hypothetical protein